MYSLGELSVYYVLTYFEIRLSEFMYHFQSGIVTFSHAKSFYDFIHRKNTKKKTPFGRIILQFTGRYLLFIWLF